jgi:hypothetical protein
MLIEVIEILPPAARGRCAALVGVATAIGFLMADAVVYGIKITEWELVPLWRWGFRLSLLLGLWPALMVLAVLPWCVLVRVDWVAGVLSDCLLSCACCLLGGGGSRINTHQTPHTKTG